MSPVWHTSTSVVAQPTAWAVSSHMRSASARPGSPVAALALPELSTTAAARPSARCRRLTCTGAAATRLAGEHAGGGDRRAVGGGDHGEVGRARRLDARREPAGLEPGNRR